MRVVFISLVLILPTLAISQTKELQEYNNLLLRTQESQSLKLEYTNIEGNPYSNEELIPGTIVFVSGNQMDNIPLRYNWYRKDMEFENEGKVLAMPEMKEIDHIIINGNKYVPFYYLKSIKGYLVELVKGEYSLFRAEDVRFINAKPPASGYDDYQPAKFDWYRTKYYVISLKGNVIELAPSKKKLVQQFPGYEKQISNFIKENKLTVRKEEDLTAIIEMLNSLQQESTSPEK